MKLPLTSLAFLLFASCSLRSPSAFRQSPASLPDPDRLEHQDGAAQRAAFELARRSVDGNSIPYKRYIAAHERARRMPVRKADASSAPGGTLLSSWTSLGPANMGGMSRSLVIDSTNPLNMYTTGINGGVWKSTDGGATWGSRGDFLPLLVIGSLAISPSDPNTLYAGTGDGFISYDAVRGGGIFMTSDGGDSWIQLDSTATDDRFQFVNKLVVSPNNGSVVYAATNAGVLRSDDSGLTWNLILDRGFPNRGCHDLTIRSDQQTDVMLASCGIPGLRVNGGLLNKVNPQEDGTLPAVVFYNGDASNNNSSWTTVLADPRMGRTSLAVAPSNQNVVYASASALSGSFANALLAIYRSNDGGLTWAATATNTSSNVVSRLLFSYADQVVCGGSTDYTGQAWHDNTIAVDPVDPNRVWVGGVDLFRSDDGGVNWAIASHWSARPGTSGYVHADQHVVLFHPNYDGVQNFTAFVVNDGGVFRTDNARAPLDGTSAGVCSARGSVAWSQVSVGLSTFEFYQGSILPNGAGYFGGAQDNGTALGTDASGPLQWTAIGGGDGGPTAIDPNLPSVWYISQNNDFIEKSTNSGRSFSNATRGITESSANFFLIGTFAMDPNDSAKLWTGGNTIWRTVNAAQSWTAASAPLVQNSFGSFAIAPGDSNQVLAGSRTGEIFHASNALTTNASSIWPHSTPRVGWVSALVYDPQTPANVYAVYSSFNVNPGDAHLYKSTDGGTTWMSWSGAGDSALPDAPFFTLVIHPDTPSTMWIAGDLGLFVTYDGGVTWAREDPSFPYVPTNYLTIQRDSQGLALYAFTHGRGLWRARIGAPASGSPSIK